MTTIGSIATAREAFTRYIIQCEASRKYLTSQRQSISQPTSDALTALAIIQHFGSIVSMLTTLANTPGVAEYAKAQASDPAYDVVAEFNAILSAMINARDTLIGMFPKDGGGFLLYQKLNPDGTVFTRSFTAAQLAPVVALLDSVIAVLS